MLPAGYDVAVCLTFDVDADTGADRRGFDTRLSMRSEALFAIRRGLPRLLDLLASRGVRSTFYVPGDVARRHAEALARILADGHEIGHHGHAHLLSDQISEAEQAEEIALGLDALEQALGVVPLGYRSPGWELTPETLRLIVQAGFAYDSSCMGDDRPYVERHGDHEILELPVHWSLDDWVFFGFTRDEGGRAPALEGWRAAWWEEFESALEERRLVTFTMHPEIIGRGYRARALAQLIDRMNDAGRVWWPTQGELASAVGRLEPEPGHERQPRRL